MIRILVSLNILKRQHDLTRIIIFLFVTITLSSCVTGMLLVKKDYAPMDNKFIAIVENKSRVVKGKGPDRYISQTTILDLFELSKGNADSIICILTPITILY